MSHQRRSFSSPRLLQDPRPWHRQTRNRPPTTEETPAGPPQTRTTAFHPAAEANELQPHTQTARKLRKIVLSGKASCKRTFSMLPNQQDQTILMHLFEKITMVFLWRREQGGVGLAGTTQGVSALGRCVSSVGSQGEFTFPSPQTSLPSPEATTVHNLLGTLLGHFSASVRRY